MIKMTKYNVLLLSTGRRVELVQSFQNAVNKLNISGNVIAGDCVMTAPATYFADKKVLLPRIHEENYIDEIIRVCKKEDIKLVIPTIDTDLLLLAKEKEKIEAATGAKVLVSSFKVVSICRDKISTQKFLEENGFKVPKMYSKSELNAGKLRYPLFIKPKSGSSSVNVFKVNSFEELRIYRSLIKEPIVQDYIEGDEFSVDVFLDFDSILITAVPRLRIATRGGEISKGKIVKDIEIINDIKRLVAVLKPIGHITVQLKKTKKGIEYIEINPRFGGGAPMSIQSGADSCENLYRLLMGEKLEYNEDYRENISFFRFDNSIAIDENGEIIQW